MPLCPRFAAALLEQVAAARREAAELLALAAGPQDLDGGHVRSAQAEGELGAGLGQVALAGGSISIPIEIVTLATTRSTIRNGR